MPDIFTKEKRSEIMSRIRGKNTKVEVMFRKALSADVYPRGYRYRIHYKKVIGSPDVVFVKRKIAIFIDGDFWHGRGYGTKGWKPPRQKFWRDKIEANRRRDRRVSRTLRKEDWTVLRFWETDVKKDVSRHVAKVAGLL